RVRRQLRVHNMPRDRQTGRSESERDGRRRSRSPRHCVGPDAAVASRVPGGDQGRRRVRAADVHAQLRAGGRRHSARQVVEESPGGDAVKWTDSEDIAIALAEKFPDLDPLTMRFTDLRDRVVALEGFSDDPKASNEPKLEAIQMAWYEEYKEQRA